MRWPGWVLGWQGLRIRLEVLSRDLVKVTEQRDAALLAEANAHGQMREAKRNADRFWTQLELERERYVALAGEMVKLKRRGFEPAPRGPRAQPDVDENAKGRAETQALHEAMREKRDSYIANAKEGLMKEGLSEQAAMREAERLFAEAISF